MREAMAIARLGDDVYGEDPTVNELEALGASRVGKEAGLFVASGTMGNLTCILSLTSRGDEAIVGLDSHCYRSEAGGMATLGGVVPKPLATDKFGKMDPEMVEQAVNSDDVHYAQSRLIVLENTYAARGGMPVDIAYMREIRSIADRHELLIHLDGARLFNAAISLGVEASELTQYVDTVSFCLSKGLCAPVGSLVCGSSEFITTARRTRKVLGGGMRQAGVIAAAGIVALNEMVERLAQDHVNAKFLALELDKISGILIDTEMVKSNIIFFQLDPEVPFSADQVADELKRAFGIAIDVTGERSFRVVTHYWVGQHEMEKLVYGLASVLMSRHHRRRRS